MSTLNMHTTVLLRWNEDYTSDAKTAYVSGNAEQLLGYSKLEFMREPTLFSDFIHKDDLLPLADELKDAVDAKDSFFSHEPYRFITKDGTTKWIEHHTMLVRNENDVVVGYISYLSDVEVLR